jgi:glycosyltransferase involved in cell wall biosynthesis
MEEIEGDRLAEKIEAILAREELPKVSANGRALIEDEYSFGAAVERYRTIFRSLEGRKV